MRAQELMTRPAVTCHVNDPLNLAAKQMWDHDCGVLAVVNDDGKLTGMLTDRDICMAAYTQGRSLDGILVNVAMSHAVVAATPTQKLDKVEALMVEHHVHRIPVVDDVGRPLGVISLHDLAKASVQSGAHGRRVAETLAAVATKPGNPSSKAV